ncbi:MAG: aminopeptidase P N-terminal domain-containing protein, partial [Ignavibacteria bacterium]|nr:aminopeptidase P N-terminal domain-containing protein [Ignavibacteria bacterium]
LVLYFISFASLIAGVDDVVITPEEFATRRAKLLSLLDSTQVVVLKSADYKIRSNDVEYRYRQESNFLYLTGIKEPNFILLLTPKPIEIENKNVNMILFSDNKIEDGSFVLFPNEIKLSSTKFNTILSLVLKDKKTLFLSAPDLNFIKDWLNDKSLFIAKNSIKELEQKFPGLKVKNANSIISKLRQFKSNAELEQIRKSIDITRKGIISAIKKCKPGIYEYELQAEIEYEMTRGGADYTAFPSIIGSGENSLILHYSKNKRQVKEKDVVVIDVGSEFNGYACDITRTIPASGKFTEAQRKIYSAVLNAQEEIFKIIKPGITFEDIERKAKEVITQAGYGKFIRHGVSHSFGLDVHEMTYDDTLKVGMVFTVEPGIYIPPNAENVSEEYRGFGIRIEDDVLVTENGCEVLTLTVPRKIDEIEGMMRE